MIDRQETNPEGTLGLTAFLSSEEHGPCGVDTICAAVGARFMNARHLIGGVAARALEGIWGGGPSPLLRRDIFSSRSFSVHGVSHGNGDVELFSGGDTVPGRAIERSGCDDSRLDRV
jgi:hypothetical protein